MSKKKEKKFQESKISTRSYRSTTMLRHQIRRITTANRLLDELKTSKDIEKFLNNSTWSIKELLQQPLTNTTTKEVSSDVVTKMLKLSGLSDSQDIQNIRKSLNLQMMFINHLYDKLGNNAEKKVNDNNCMFRLLASDHIPQRPLDLDTLMDEINKLEPSEEKGEIGFGIKDLQRDSFVINKK